MTGLFFWLSLRGNRSLRTGRAFLGWNPTPSEGAARAVTSVRHRGGTIVRPYSRNTPKCLRTKPTASGTRRNEAAVVRVYPKE